MTRRAFFIGLLMASWVNLWPAYSSLILHSSRADYANLSVALLIPFLCLLAFNLALERRGGGLSSSELLVICCICLCAATALLFPTIETMGITIMETVQAVTPMP